ncbi:hypothetical protein J0S82_006787, partial [Galemys pyrenaicus]
YYSLRIGGLTIAGVLFILGILIVLSPPRAWPCPAPPLPCAQAGARAPRCASSGRNLSPLPQSPPTGRRCRCKFNQQQR